MSTSIIAILVVVGVVLVIIALVLGLGLFALVAEGALRLLGFANQGGFVGIIAYFAAWVFLFPLMLIWSLVAGYMAMPAKERDEQVHKRKLPTDPDERYNWANRLPPYDQ